MAGYKRNTPMELYRSGKKPEEIAAILKMPVREVNNWIEFYKKIEKEGLTLQKGGIWLKNQVSSFSLKCSKNFTNVKSSLRSDWYGRFLEDAKMQKMTDLTIVKFFQKKNDDSTLFFVSASRLLSTLTIMIKIIDIYSNETPTLRSLSFFFNFKIWRLQIMSEMEWMDIFGDNLVDLLKEARMTQHELAETAGLTDAAISNYINKRRMPNVKALINISEALDISLDELMFFGDTID